jgi:predicted cobalt transporter CbtA
MVCVALLLALLEIAGIRRINTMSNVVQLVAAVVLAVAVIAHAKTFEDCETAYAEDDAAPCAALAALMDCNYDVSSIYTFLSMFLFSCSDKRDVEASVQ